MKSKSTPSRFRSLALKLLLLGVSSLIGLLLVEAGVRWFLPFYAPSGQIGFVGTTNGIALGPAGQSSRQATFPLTGQA